MPHSTLEPHAALLLWAQLAVLLTASHALGALARRLHQPTIVGSLLAGVLLGPSVFGQLWPGGFGWLFTSGGAANTPVGTVAAVCLLLLLVVLGAETDLPLIRRLGKASVLVTTVSAVLPLAAGLALGYAAPHTVMGQLAGGGSRLAFAIVLGGVVSVSSLPVVATIMSELGLTRRNFGQLSIAAATVHDAYGFLLLALALALGAGTAAVTALLEPLLGLAVLVAVLALTGQRVVDAALRRARRRGPNLSAALGIALVVTLGLAAATQAIGIDGALGAFLAGLLLGRSRFQQSEALRMIQRGSAAVFSPLYFATAGLQVDVTTIRSGPLLVALGVLVAVAMLSKYAGGVAGGRLAALSWRESSVLGIGLNGRGALQVILGSSALAAGIFTPTAYTLAILMSIAGSVAVPPVLRRTARGFHASEEERVRLAEEGRLRANVVVRGQRLLLPSRGSANSAAAAAVLDAAWPASSEVTILTIGEGAADGRGFDEVRRRLGDRPVRHIRGRNRDGPPAILDEVRLGYGAVGVGAGKSTGEGGQWPPVVERLLRESPIPVVLARRGGGQQHGARRFRRVLVPTTGNAASEAAQEVAHNISERLGAPISLLHVVTRPAAAPRRDRDGGDGWPQGAVPAAHHAATAVLDEAVTAATSRDAEAHPLLGQGESAAAEIEATAREIGADLVVLGASARQVAGRPFLGHTVEHVLEHLTEATVVVVVVPDTRNAVAAMTES
jgi:Kef-type K+ transport system membrane component KefB/nucleotide-binding universal stress UspA family protein